MFQRSDSRCQGLDRTIKVVRNLVIWYGMGQNKMFVNAATYYTSKTFFGRYHSLSASGATKYSSGESPMFAFVRESGQLECDAGPTLACECETRIETDLRAD